MKMKIKPFCNTEIIFTTVDELKKKIFSLQSRNIVFIMSLSSASRSKFEGFIENFQNECSIHDNSFTWIKEVDTNPTQKSIIKALQQIGDKKVDVIIAIGGGSAIDLAKGISAFYNNNSLNRYDVEEITRKIHSKDYVDNQFIDIIAVPTTAGTGSELTQWATIWDEKKAVKYSIDTEGLTPKKAIIVPELTLTVSKKMTLSTGLDAMCQAIEAYWSKHTNPLVQDISYRAVELILQNLKKSLEVPEDMVSREKLCRASVLAALAFSQTRTTACHSISYPLTMLYNVPHGLAVALTIDSISKINKGHFPNDNELYNLFNDYGGIKNWIDIVSEGIVEMKLSSFGVTYKDIPIIVDNAFTAGRMDNNPVNLSGNDVVSVLKSIL